MGDYGFEGAAEYPGQDTNFNCGGPPEPSPTPSERLREIARRVSEEADRRASERPDGDRAWTVADAKNLAWQQGHPPVFETNFTVFPTDTNYNVPPCVFGGKMLAMMDNAAAMCSREALWGTGATDAVTVHVEVDFRRPAFVGEVVYLRATVREVGHKSITVGVSAVREDRQGEQQPMGGGTFVFVARKDGVPFEHGLDLMLRSEPTGT